ncbi:MAG: formate--tetrahydrofolate ligase [Deltaproteobacteria bacterium]
MSNSLNDIQRIAGRLGIRPSELHLHGRYKAKVDLSILGRVGGRRGTYVLVTAITPTPMGEGKTVTTIGLSMALNRMRRRAVATLRQASLGPLFGAKGVGTGGGACQIVPADDVNLHLTGDMLAVEVANNLLVSFVENAVFQGNALDIEPDSILIRRCLDVGDRALRHIAYTLKAKTGPVEVRTGFEITAASESMSVVTLARDFADMRRRLKELVVARDRKGRFVTARDVKADGMMAAVLKDALKPNLVQTSAGTPCLVHTGPFANVSVGTCSILADRIGLGLCDYVVTESGFGSDCGGEKFFDIKCRYSGLAPDVCVLVCSVRGLKAQSARLAITPGRSPDPALFREDLAALNEGLANLRRHIENVRLFGVPVVVCVNVFPTDTPAERALIMTEAARSGVEDVVESTAWRDGAAGAMALARSVERIARAAKAGFRLLYEDDLGLCDKIARVARKVYGAADVDFSPQAREGLRAYEEAGYGKLPVCIAKTQFSFSADEHLKGAPSGFVFPVKDVRLAAGAGFVLAHASLSQTMPGLPVHPRGEKIDVDADGRIVGMD